MSINRFCAVFCTLYISPHKYTFLYATVIQQCLNLSESFLWLLAPSKLSISSCWALLYHSSHICFLFSCFTFHLLTPVMTSLLHLPHSFTVPHSLLYFAEGESSFHLLEFTPCPHQKAHMFSKGKKLPFPSHALTT